MSQYATAMEVTVRHSLRALCSVLFVLFLLAPATAAPPHPPERVGYQGVLLDDLGAPRTGTVDITVRVFDALAGGVKLYVQMFPSVPLTDGVFAVELGPLGAATDPPVDPVTTSLADALIADIAATTTDRYLEVTAGTETALSRTQILTVPYALRSEETGHAASADLATLATTASEASAVNGIPSSFVSEMFEHTNFDNTGPGNSDPTEGLGDTDLDGIANFVDPDNDNDGLSDGVENSQGSDINLVTPIVTQVVPSFGRADLVQTVSVEGSSFEPGITVGFGTQTPTPTNVTASSFDVDVGPAVIGTVSPVVTRLNGETDQGGSFSFAPLVAHSIQKSDGYFSFDVTGTESVVIGGSNDLYWADGQTRSFPTAVENHSSPGQLAVAFDPLGRVVGLRCRDTAPGCDVEYAVDSDGDSELTDEVGLAFDTPSAVARIRGPSIVFDPSGNPVLAYHKSDTGSGFISTVAHDRDGDGFFTGTNELVTIGFPEGIQQDNAEVAVDASGRVAYAYYDSNDNAIQVAWDRSGDGDYDDTVGGNAEFFPLVTTTNINCLGVAFAPDGDLVLVYDRGTGLIFNRDTDGDGDFTGVGEVVNLDPTSSGACDVSAADGNDVAVAYVPDDDTLIALIDRNDDGDFVDTDENVLISVDADSIAHVRVAHNDVGKVFVATGDGDQFVAGDPTP